MTISKKQLSATEMLQTLAKQWLTTADIKRIACCGYDKARAIRDGVANYLKEKNYYFPSGYLPTKEVIEYLKIDVNYLKKLSNIERSLKEEKN